MRSFWFLLICPFVSIAQVPDGFVNIQQINSRIMVDLRYYSIHNFVGDTVDGYQAPILYLSEPAAMALGQVQVLLETTGLGLKVYDAYRPQQAVDHFVRWSQDLGDTLTKRQYYPDQPKALLFDLGYISSRSGHTRGSTVDLTLVELATGKELDMGSPWDLFDARSHHDYTQLSPKQKKNRLLLKSIMEENGFRAYSKEWWHYTLRDEPFPETYFNFQIR